MATRTKTNQASTNHKPIAKTATPLEKAATGIRGLDEITGGGLPRGRTTIVCGGAGCGKTMLGIEFLVRGAQDFNEPGVLMAFEENPQEMAKNVVSLSFDLNGLAARKKLFLDYVHIEPAEIQETGEYDLEGLFVRLQHAVDTVGAKRVFLDTIEALFSGFSNAGILRAELRRLFRWLKDRELTTVITAERGEGALTRHGLEEYVSDCVVLLDHRIHEQISTRRLRIVKYRGTSHGADEFPFLIGEQGISVLPITSLELQQKVSNERISTGVADLDQMLEGKGYFRGTSVLVSGTAGSGKTTLAASFARAVCERGERCLYIGFEESASQILRNVKSVGLDLQPWITTGNLVHNAWRPTQHGLESHLLRIHKLIEEVKPQAVVIDPISDLITASTHNDVQSMVLRLMDFLKDRQITGLFTSLTTAGARLEATEVGISSLIDTWILLRDMETNGERNRLIYVLKSRGMAHSNQLREFLMTSQGIHLLPAYVGAEGVLTGSSRVAQEAREKASTLVRVEEVERKQRALETKRLAIEAQIRSLEAAFRAEEEELKKEISQSQGQETALTATRQAIATSRRAATESGEPTAKGKAAGGEE